MVIRRKRADGNIKGNTDYPAILCRERAAASSAKESRDAIVIFIKSPPSTGRFIFGCSSRGVSRAA
jgi:hypothetical protein